MKRRKYLATVVGLIVFAGFILASVPFIGSLKPSAKSEANLPRIDLSGLKIGELIWAKHPTHAKLINGFEWSVLFYRKQDGQILAWDLPTSGEFTGLPDFHWWRPEYKCFNFGPTIVDGAVDETKPIKCHDSETKNNIWYLSWEWDISGRAITHGLQDMYRTKGVVNGNFFVFHKRS